MDLPLAFCLVLDIYRHPRGQRRNIDIVKTQLADFIKSQVEIHGYLYKNEEKVKINRSHIFAADIASYKQLEDFDFEIGLKEGIYILGNCDDAMNKHLIFITDIYDDRNKAKYINTLLVDKKEDFEYNILFFGIGCDLSEICKNFRRVKFIHLDSAEQLKEKLIEEIKWKRVEKDQYQQAIE